MIQTLALRDYQTDALDSLLSPPPDVWRDLAVMATGGGKTILFAALIDRLIAEGERALVLAHREELLDQARDKIASVAPGLHVEIEQAERRATRLGDGFSFYPRSVVVASVQTLHERRRAGFAADAFRLVIVDEAHHSTAKSYVDILEHFGCLSDDRRTRLVGVTATPNRTDGKPLGDIYQRIACEYGIRELVRREWLVPPRAIRLQTDTDLSGVTVRMGDYAQGELERAVNSDARNGLILRAMREHCAGRQTIIFCAGVEHAHELASMLRSAGITAAPIWGAMDHDERVDELQRFRDRKTQVLTNFGVLTEGFDVPEVEAIVLARPTTSSLLMTQMVGRGLRLAPDKTDCLIVDVQDVTRRTTCVSAASLAGLPTGFDAQGADLFALRERLDELDPRLAARALTAEQIEEFIAKTAAGMDVIQIDLLAATSIDPTVERCSSYSWSCIAPDTYAVGLGQRGAEVSIRVDTLGQWQAFLRPTVHATWAPLETPVASVEEVFQRADRYILGHWPDAVRLIDRKATWRTDSPSDKQIQWLLKKKVFASRDEIPETLTKGQASTLLDKAFGRG